MQNFEIEGTTGQDLNQSVKKASQEQKNDQPQDQNPQQLSQTFDKIDPINILLTTIFKIISVSLYLILKLLTDSYLATFVVTVLLISFDFWTVKNLTARKLVGLRWWSQMTEQGEQQWIFQSRNPSRVPHNFNVTVFWISQLIALLFWAIIVIINIFTISLFWIALALFCELMTAINFICFFKCRGQHQRRAQEISVKFGIKALGSVSGSGSGNQNGEL